MLDTIKRLFGRTQTKSVTAIADLFGGIELSKLTDYESYIKAGSQKVWATWKACDICAKAVVQTPFKIVRDGSSEPVKVLGLEELLRAPNPRETFGDVVARSVFHLKLTGNAYWLKDQSTIKGDRPKALVSLNPHKTKIVPNRDGTLKGYLYSVNGEDVPLDVEEVIHFKMPHPNNDWYGLGEVEPGEALFQEQINRDTYAQAFWKNGARPSGVMTLKQQFTGSQEEWDKAQERFNQRYAGAKNAGKAIFIQGDWSYNSIGLTAQEMQALEHQKWTVESIFLMHGVPLSVAGVRDAANYATADIDNQRFKEFTVLPLVKILADTLNTDLVMGYGDKLRIVFEVSGLTSVASLMQGYGPLFDRGAMSVNDLRVAAGLPRIEDPQFDQHFILGSYTPLELAGLAATAQPVDQQARSIAQRQ